MIGSWNPEMGRKQDEIKGPAALTMVLPGLRETMPR